ncbi:hypothetical protein NE237_024046 [Protea cynaroides]|uniref:BZIP domain-containing protein n=1 Tax=Protea cynaroides TaxID=273540 RepID=A0A9Q0HHC1_9MAGN|nr:hypothetical protein NE237_024046 [Protea cynaroides]
MTSPLNPSNLQKKANGEVHLLGHREREEDQIVAIYDLTVTVSIYAMANSKGSSNIRNFLYSGKQSLLPPKSPFPGILPSYAECGTSPEIGSKGIPKPREANRHHQRTSSESFLIEEQPSWLDDLLNEPETPVRRGHRRSSSDSYAYLDVANASNMENVAQEDKFKNASVPIWGSLEFDPYKDARHASFYTELNSFGRQQNRSWDSSLNSVNYQSGHQSSRDNIVRQISGQVSVPQESDGVPSTATDNQEQEESGSNNPKGSSDRSDNSHAKPSASEADPKRAKQQFAQRSRVRKLQYIAELERNVQALQAKGSEVSAELEFLDQQNLILSMENKALKQRLENLAHEQLIKYLEQDVLEREIARLRALYQQQQQPPQPSSGHRRASSRDLDSQFANLSIKHKEASSGDSSEIAEDRLDLGLRNLSTVSWKCRIEDDFGRGRLMFALLHGALGPPKYLTFLFSLKICIRTAGSNPVTAHMKFI